MKKMLLCALLLATFLPETGQAGFAAEDVITALDVQTLDAEDNRIVIASLEGSRLAQVYVAQGDADALAKPADPAPASAAAEPPAPTPGELLVDAKDVYSTWKLLGALAGLAALLNLLVNLTKFGPVKEWFETNKKKWLLSYLSMGLGALAGGLGAYLVGSDVVQGAVAGLMAGSMATGGHELVSNLRASKRSA